jgi:hypothetical protein
MLASGGTGVAATGEGAWAEGTVDVSVGEGRRPHAGMHATKMSAEISDRKAAT